MQPSSRLMRLSTCEVTNELEEAPTLKTTPTLERAGGRQVYIKTKKKKKIAIFTVVKAFLAYILELVQCDDTSLLLQEL